MAIAAAWLWVFVLVPFLLVLGMIGLERFEGHLFGDRDLAPPGQPVTDSARSLARGR
jgi:hypothetical protein